MYKEFVYSQFSDSITNIVHYHRTAGYDALSLGTGRLAYDISVLIYLLYIGPHTLNSICPCLTILTDQFRVNILVSAGGRGQAARYIGPTISACREYRRHWQRGCALHPLYIVVHEA